MALSTVTDQDFVLDCKKAWYIFDSWKKICQCGFFPRYWCFGLCPNVLVTFSRNEWFKRSLFCIIVSHFTKIVFILIQKNLHLKFNFACRFLKLGSTLQICHQHPLYQKPNNPKTAIRILFLLLLHSSLRGAAHVPVMSMHWCTVLFVIGFVLERKQELTLFVPRRGNYSQNSHVLLTWENWEICSPSH